MKEFIVPFTNTVLMEGDLQYFLYDLALQCHKDPTKLEELNFFVPVLSCAKKQWIVYFGTEVEVKAIDSEQFYSISWFIDGLNYTNKEDIDNALIHDEVADYICDYWVYYDKDDDDD